MNMFRRAVLTLTAIIATQNIGAAEIENVEFSESVSVAGTDLELAGLSRLYYKVIFTGAVAGLYLDDPASLDDVLADTAKRLEFVYFGGLDADDFVAAANESLAENLDAETLEKLRPKIDAFNDLYVDIEKNDRYAISYVPGRGLELAHNGEVLGTVAGDMFANTYFHIWFGDRPFNRHLKKTLLKGEFD
ncbi:hypothetical protein J2T55_000347 [Methylohalomonas lacus]|uniref:Chalcone isomerase domain-containing protein n=1 Tax=Methylohalomonas lacus TaxID=398773 RepID=A0AAE3L0Y2_9GAMM|nr:chalcone isomerase family protein [Methylohalomonas lacus]MCS3902351.1 hypothetical protein [Methylohalomonas lacus]